MYKMMLNCHIRALNTETILLLLSLLLCLSMQVMGSVRLHTPKQQQQTSPTHECIYRLDAYANLQAHNDKHFLSYKSSYVASCLQTLKSIKARHL